MNILVRRILTVSLLLLLSAQSASAQEKLVWKFKEGDAFTLENVRTDKQTVKIDGKSQTSETTTTWTTLIEVRKAGDKETVLDQTIVSIAVKGAKAAKLDKNGWAEKLKGSKFKFTVSPAGRVLKIEGHDDFVQKVGDSTELQEAEIRFLVSESALRQNLEEMIGFLPEKPVAQRAAWERKGHESVAPFGSFDMTFQYTLSGKRDGADLITFTVKADYVAPKGDLGVIRVVKGALKSEGGKGEILFDVAKGRLVRGEKRLKIHGTITLETAPKQTVVMELDSDSTVNWRVVEKK